MSKTHYVGAQVQRRGSKNLGHPAIAHKCASAATIYPPGVRLSTSELAAIDSSQGRMYAGQRSKRRPWTIWLLLFSVALALAVTRSGASISLGAKAVNISLKIVSR